MPIIDCIAGQTVPEACLGPLAANDVQPPMLSSPFRRCTGHCCKYIRLAGGRIRYADLLENLKRAASDGPWPQIMGPADTIYDCPTAIRDIELICELFEPIPDDKEGGMRCKAFTGNACSIHAGPRPHFCESYPDATYCKEPGCTAERESWSTATTHNRLPPRAAPSSL